jgi:hypothetical protein
MTTSSGIKVFPESLTYDEGWEEKFTNCQVIVERLISEDEKSSVRQDSALGTSEHESEIPNEENPIFQDLEVSLNRVEVAEKEKQNLPVVEKTVNPAEISIKTERLDICNELPFNNIDTIRPENNITTSKTSNGLIQCPKCDEKVGKNKLIDLLKHIRSVHGKDSVTRFRITKSEFLPLRCDKCEFCFTRQEPLDKHLVTRNKEKPKYTKCEANQKSVRQMHKHEKKSKKKRTEEESPVHFLEIVRAKFQCPMKKCSKLFDNIGEVIAHVKAKHTIKEFITFRAHEDFFDFLARRCERCKFIYDRWESHSDADCDENMRLQRGHKITQIERRRIFNSMVDAESLYVEDPEKHREMYKQM